MAIPVKEEIINNLIQKEKVNTNLISDGFHTFGELYEHRITLFITLAKFIKEITMITVWRYQTDKDWFILGIHTTPGKQITYHLPMEKWKETYFVTTMDKQPEFDGHTSADVLERLKNLK